MKVTAVLWDWNGTLLDDTTAALAALNAMLAKRGRAPMSMQFYRDRFSFPAKPFYESIGLDVSDEVWDDLAREYHDTYALQPKRLNAETVAALEAVKKYGAKQYIVSALRQDLLEADIARYGIGGYFTRLCGSDNLDGSGKLASARTVAAELGDCSTAVVIGDAIHDLEAAREIGARCVLCGQGSHAAWRLAKIAPTGETLLDAVNLALA